MGNIFSYYFNSNNIKYEDSLLDPLNNEEIQYASLLDIESINGQVGILEQTTQSSLKNISTDVKYLFEEISSLKKQIESIYLILDNDKNTINSNDSSEDITNTDTTNQEVSIYLDANNINQDEVTSSEETY